MGAVDAFEAALRLLRHRDLSLRDLEERLARRGYAADEIERALQRLLGAGLVDDARYARARASFLASRGAGDDLIRSELEASGVPSEHVADALSALDPEHVRASAILGRRGASPRTSRYLLAKGFDDEVVQALVASGQGGELG